MPEQLKIIIHLEDSAYWATVDEYPGVFATGDTLEELRVSLEEGVSLYLSEPGRVVQVELGPLQGADVVATHAHAQLACA